MSQIATDPSESLDVAVGRRVHHLMWDRRITQTALGRALKIDQSGVGRRLRGDQRGPHMHPMSVNKIITRITGWNPHSLRHAGATAAYNETHDLRGVQEMLGHASLAVTERYLHLDDASRRRVAAATEIILPRAA